VIDEIVMIEEPLAGQHIGEPVVYDFPIDPLLRGQGGGIETPKCLPVSFDPAELPQSLLIREGGQGRQRRVQTQMIELARGGDQVRLELDILPGKPRQIAVEAFRSGLGGTAAGEAGGHDQQCDKDGCEDSESLQFLSSSLGGQYSENIRCRNVVASEPESRCRIPDRHLESLSTVLPYSWRLYRTV